MMCMLISNSTVCGPRERVTYQMEQPRDRDESPHPPHPDLSLEGASEAAASFCWFPL